MSKKKYKSRTSKRVIFPTIRGKANVKKVEFKTVKQEMLNLKKGNKKGKRKVKIANGKTIVLTKGTKRQLVRIEQGLIS